MVSASARTRQVTGGWLLAAAQCALALGFAYCAYLALDRAARLAEFLPAAPGSRYPEVDPLSGWAWGYGVLWTLQGGALLAGLSLVATAVLLITGYSRGNRPLSVTMAGGAVVAVLVVAAGVTPGVQGLIGWLTT